MDYSEFEDGEIEKFLKQKALLCDVKNYLIGITEEEYGPVRDITKDSIKKGIEEYMINLKYPCLYESDLSKFFHDDSTQKILNQELQGRLFNKNQVLNYSKYIAKSYAFFIYDESAERYFCTFGS